MGDEGINICLLSRLDRGLQQVRRLFGAVAVSVKEPTVIRTANAGLFGDAVGEGASSVRTKLRDKSQLS